MKQTSQSYRVSWLSALGRARLYASAYFPPHFGKGIVSLVPSVWRYIFFPALVASIALLLSLIAVKGMFSAADYPWLSRLAGVVATQAAADSDVLAVLIGLVAVALALYRQRWHVTLGWLLASTGYSSHYSFGRAFLPRSHPWQVP